MSLPQLNIDDISADSDEIEEEFQSIYTATAAQDPGVLSDNWMFKRRGEDGTSSVVSATSPVGMLVPSPTEDIRTQIGDRNADEIESDLSEGGSDLDLDDPLGGNDNEKDRLNVTIDVPHVLVESKTLISGKNEMSSFDHSKLFDLLEPGSLVSEQSLTGQSPVISEAKNELLLLEVANHEAEGAEMERRQTQPNAVEAVNDLLDFGPISQHR